MRAPPGERACNEPSKLGYQRGDAMKDTVISEATKAFLQNAIQSAAGRQPFEMVSGNAPVSRPSAARKLLTKRQLDVLALLCRGMTNKDIGRTLGIGNATVKIHVSSILRALNVDSRLQATIAARRLGLTVDDQPIPNTVGAPRADFQPVVLRVVWDGSSAQIIGVDQETVIT